MQPPQLHPECHCTVGLLLREYRGGGITSSSSALYFSASCTIFSISSLLRRPLSLVMVILLFLPADKCRRSVAALMLLQAYSDIDELGLAPMFRSLLSASLPTSTLIR